MFEWIIQADIWSFFFINKTLANPVFDIIMPFITNDKIFRIPILLIWLSLICFGGKRGRIAAFLIIFTILISDQVSSFVIKPLVGRIRPCNALEGVRLLVGCSGSFSFTSSHAANMFAASGLFSFFYPKAKGYFYFYAGMVAYSRTYIGIHYPLDILGGAAFGLGVAGLIILVYRQLLMKFLPKLLDLDFVDNK